MKTKNIQDLVNQIQSDDWHSAIEASNELVKIGGKEVFDALIPLLKSSSAQTRNAVALTLRELKNNAAVIPIIESIKSPADPKNIGTLVYSLETLDCSAQFKFLFDLCLTSNYEVKMGCTTIFSEQEVFISEEDLIDAKNRLKQFELINNNKDDISLLNYLNELLNSFKEDK